MKSLLVTLWLQCLHDCARMGSYPGTTRDKTTVLSRVESEGESFLTLTLPSFARDFERGLEQGFVDSTLFREFRKNGSIPAFLRGMTSRVFDEYGVLRSVPDIKAIRHIRQLCLMFKKLKAQCTPKRVQRALDAYERVECDLANLKVDRLKLSRFELVSKVLWRNFELSSSELRPKFGPGVTADRLSHKKRREWPVYHARLDTFFPLYGTALSVGAIGIDDTSLVAEEQECPVRVILVPKTLKAPRVIAAEPACMQFCQQALLDHLDRRIERLFSQYISLRDQNHNRHLASDLACATLDLKEASDRCHGALVYLMLGSCPNLRDMSFACRSTSATLPSGKVIPLQKYASMGSALCFPYETMLFFSIVVMCQLGSRSIRAVPDALNELKGKCSIFGDDIIVPKELASSVICELEAFGLRVNRDKSFVTGKFRETCGVDMYDGVLVTPTYVRYVPTLDDPSAVVSLVSAANKFYQQGYHDTAFCISRFYKSLRLHRVPDDRYVGFIFSGSEKTRYNIYLHRREFVTHVGIAKVATVRNDDVYGLSDWFIRSLRSHDTEQMRERSKDTFLKLKKVWTAF